MRFKEVLILFASGVRTESFDKSDGVENGNTHRGSFDLNFTLSNAQRDSLFLTSPFM